MLGRFGFVVAILCATAVLTGVAQAKVSPSSGKRHPPAPVNTSVPTISGTAAVGNVLTASTGTWSNSPTSYGYQWSDCNSGGTACTNISGATSSSHTVGSSEVGDTIRVAVTAKNAGGSATATSAPTSVVPASGGSGPGGLLVSGNHLVNTSGATVHLHGVNRSGPEYACIQGWGIFDGPNTAASVAAM
ncbi:MAG: hypothetical protein QOJ25_2394, partial [Solirubrobacteraceae bacterium]|nr:hypothetical protein [Solirubrobacteraceae bacterium]